MIELANAAGFPSNITVTDPSDGTRHPAGDGIPTHLIDRYQCRLRLHYILVAFSRFNRIVHATPGTEDTKVAAALSIYSPPPPSCFTCGAIRDDLLKCNGCLSAYFCNASCQKAGWKRHKSHCKHIRKLREKGQHTHTHTHSDLNAGLFLN